MKRALLFLLLLALGVSLLLVLAREEPGSPLRPETPGVDESAPASESASQNSRTYTEGLRGTHYETAVGEDGKETRTPRYHYEWNRAYDEGQGLFRLEQGGSIRILQEKDPEKPSLILHAESGKATLFGSLGEMQIAEDQPLHFETVLADLFDPEGEVPPIRIRTSSIDGLLAEHKFWTDARVHLEHPDSEDFRATGEGMDGNALEGSVVLRKNASLSYLLRPAEGAAPDRELRLSCLGPLRILKARNAQGQERRLLEASGDVLFEMEELQSRAVQRLRAEKLLAWIRPDRLGASEPGAKSKSPIAFERVEVSGKIRLETGDATLLGDRADAEIGKDGELRELRIVGSPRAVFSGSSARSLAGSEKGAAEASPLFVLCDGPISIFEEGTQAGVFEMRFERHVLLLGGGDAPHRPRRFEDHLCFLFEKGSDAAGDGGFRILAAHAEGGVVWNDSTARVLAPAMELEPQGEGFSSRISFFPSPILATRLRSDPLGGRPGGEGANAEKTLLLWASRSLSQESLEGSEVSSRMVLEGTVLGSIHAEDSPPGSIEASGLRILTAGSGSARIFAEKGFFYDEGVGGLRIVADRIVPVDGDLLRLEGAPAQLRQPGSGGKNFDISAGWIELGSSSPRLTAGGGVDLLLPEEAAPLLAGAKPPAGSSDPVPLRLRCESLEGERGEGEAPLLWLRAELGVRILGREQEAGGLSLHLDFVARVHRLFGSIESPAWISGPIDRGRFSARSQRIEILKEGERIELAPHAEVEIRGEAANFGRLSSSNGEGGIRVLPRAESSIERGLIYFGGGVRVESLEPRAEDSWTMLCREIALFRNPDSGALDRMEAAGQVSLVSAQLLSRSDRLHFWPQTSRMLLLGEAGPAELELPGETVWSSPRIEYNLETHLIQSGPGSVTF